MWPNIEDCCCTVIKRINGCIIQCGIQSEAKPQREFRGEVAKMGYSRFRLSHVMPNVWFYKLRDLGRTRNQRGRRTAGKLKLESCSTLPRNSYHFGRAERVYASPPNPKLSDTDYPPEGRKQEEAVGSAAYEPRRRYTGGTKTKSKSKSKSRSSTLRQSRISAGCSCRATVGSVWKSRENEDRWSSDECSDEFGENVRFRSTQPVLENCSGGKNNCHDISKFDKLESEVAWDFPALELNPSRSQNFPQVGNHRNKHIIRYVSNNIAGLPSPVPEEQHGDDYEYEDFCSEFDDSVARNVKEIFESVRDPYFVDTCITCSSSCSCRLSTSSVEIDVNNMDGDGNLPTDYEGNSIKEVGILPFLAESVDPDMKMKQKYMEDLEESKPSLIRHRNAVNSQAEVKASKLMAPESRNRRHSSETTCLNDQKPPISGKRVDSGATEIQPQWKGNAVSQRSEIPTKKAVTEGKSRSAKARQHVGSVSGSPKSDIGNAISKRRRDFPQRSTDQKITKSKGNSPRPSTRISKPNGSGPSKTKITGEQSDDQLKDIQQKFGVDDARSRKSSSSSSIATTVPESFAVVKCSYDPQKDFRDSMVEMIVENDIRFSKDLQQLLHSYLLLNSDEYHDVIVKVFEQVWSDLNDISL